MIKKANYVFSRITYTSLGHLIEDPLFYNHFYEAGIFKRRAIFLIEKNKAASEAFIQENRFKEHIFAENSFLKQLIDSGYAKDIVQDTSSLFRSYKRRINPAYEVFDKLGDTGEGLQESVMHKEAEEQFSNFKKEYGVEENKYICLHARADGFKGDKYECGGSGRNTDVKSLNQAIDYLSKRGIKVIRMGNSHMPEFRRENVIDYANSNFSGQWLDLVIIKNCLFYLGDSSGANSMALQLGKPIFLYNVCLPMQLSAYRKGDISIVKPVIDIKKMKIVSIEHVLEKRLDTVSSIHELNARGYGVIANSSKEITELTQAAVYITTMKEKPERFGYHWATERKELVDQHNLQYSFISGSRGLLLNNMNKYF